MKNKSLFLLIVCCLCATTFYGQQTGSVTISSEKSAANDTIWLSIVASPNTKPGTLMVVAASSQINAFDTSYYPVIDSASTVALAVPPDFRTGLLQLRAYFYPKIFEVTGKVLSKTKKKPVNALLITANQRIYNKTLDLTEDNRFALPGLVFEKQGSLIFNYTAKDEKDHPDVSIEQIPTTADFSDMVLDQRFVFSPQTDTTTKGKPVRVPVIVKRDSTKKYKVLENVTVTGKRKSGADKFNDAYVSDLFKSADEKVINCIDNSNILSFPDCISYLRTQIPGVSIGIDKFGENYMQWRGHETKAFYIDEIPVDIDQLLAINPSDIAIIKVYPPPYSLAGGMGDGGAVAIYTRRGEFRTNNAEPNKWLFSIKGYSSPIHNLFSIGG